MRYRSRKRESGDSGLSFLDIMACGLGAVIFIFLIIKHNIDDGGSIEIATLMEKLVTMQREMERMQYEVEDIARRNAEEEKFGQEFDTRRQSSQAALAALDDQLSAQEQQKKQLNQTNEELANKVAQAVVETPSKGNEQYLIGLSIQGKHNAILVDYSASMTHETVLNIINYKIDSAQVRKTAPKWRRARKTVKWMIDRLPADSTAVVISFNESAQVLGPQSFARADSGKVTDVITALENLDPQGGTNLQAAFELAFGLSKKPTHYYLITDGLPTKGGKGAPKCERRGTVTGMCRDRHMTHVSKLVARGVGGGVVNVVLLPLEGDWYAPSRFWDMTSRTGGLTISPAGSWP